MTHKSFLHKLSNGNLPVIVYLPHSNFLYGSGLSRDIGPDIMMDSERIVLVVVQYRIGMMGFFSTGDRHAPGNLGLKDQQLALDWVKEMIRYFSGNREDITVFGDASVQYQLMQPSIAFQKAIISGSYAFSYYNGAGAMKGSDAVWAARAFSWTLYGQVLRNKELVEKLQDEPIDKLMSVQGLIHVSRKNLVNQALPEDLCSLYRVLSSTRSTILDPSLTKTLLSTITQCLSQSKTTPTFC
jgi:carboxylesterase type B